MSTVEYMNMNNRVRVEIPPPHLDTETIADREHRMRTGQYREERGRRHNRLTDAIRNSRDPQDAIINIADVMQDVTDRHENYFRNMNDQIMELKRYLKDQKLINELQQETIANLSERLDSYDYYSEAS